MLKIGLKNGALMFESIKTVIKSRTRIFNEPKDTSRIETEALFGENVKILEIEKNWVNATLLSDNYNGWIKSVDLGQSLESTHHVSAIRSHIYESPSSKSLSILPLSLGSKVKALNDDGAWTEINIESSSYTNGFVPSNHLKINNAKKVDWIKTAQLFVGTPYLWGGRSSFGIDCSALIQLSLALSEITFPRNSSAQFEILNNKIIKDTAYKRGDFIYWKGHIGIILNNEEVLHSNAHHMSVTIETLDNVYSRIGKGTFIRL